MKFQIKTRGGSYGGGGAQILLSSCDGCDGYLIIIGGWQNNWSVIRHTKGGSNLVEQRVLTLGVRLSSFTNNMIYFIRQAVSSVLENIGNFGSRQWSKIQTSLQFTLESKGNSPSWNTPGIKKIDP